MSVIRALLTVYRKLQYRVCCRSEYGTMPAGLLCKHTPFQQESNHGDVVHPCVRFIPEGYLGHKWWMVYTPYYASNDKTENPILCYAETDDSIPPTEWIVAYQVQGQPSQGYNSDPTLLYDNGNLYVMWRENQTKRCEKAGNIRATFGALVGENDIGEVFGPLVGTDDYETDAEVSPTFLKGKDGEYICYAMHLKFHSYFISSQRLVIRKFLNGVATVLDLLGIWSQQRSYGIALWKSDKLEGPYFFDRTLPFINCNKLYRPWHMDFFEYENRLYSIVQTNQCNADICLAVSDDGLYFKMLKKPLMTNRTSNKVGIYKPTGGVIKGELYLYYTAQDNDNRVLNKLYLSNCKFDEVL